MDLKSFNFTEDIQEAIKYNKWNDPTIEDRIKPPLIIDNTYHPIEAHQFKLKHSLVSLLEFQSYLYYFFISDSSSKHKQEEKKQFNMWIYMFKKKDGKNQNIALQSFKGSPNCISTGISLNLTSKQKKTEENGDQSQQITKNKMFAIIGLKEGFIKIVQFGLQNHQKMKTIVRSYKLQQKQIVSILIPGKQYYNEKSICFILTQDCKVFIFNYCSKQVLAIYQQPILGHDYALLMAFHKSGKYIATTTKSGQMTFWELGQTTFKAIEKSQEKIIKSKKAKKDEKKEAMEQQVQILQQVWHFDRKDRVLNVFPMYMLHSASIDGIKWLDFMGNLIAFITRKGLFRLIAINFQVKDEFIILLQYQISQGQSISTVQLFPQRQLFYVTKSKQFLRVIDHNGPISTLKDHQKLKWKQSMLKCHNSSINYRMNFNGIENCQQQQSILQRYMISDDEDLRIENITMMKLINSENNNPVNFKETILSHNKKFLLARTDKEFYISLLEDQEQSKN